MAAKSIDGVWRVVGNRVTALEGYDLKVPDTVDAEPFAVPCSAIPGVRRACALMDVTATG